MTEAHVAGSAEPVGDPRRDGWRLSLALAWRP